MRLPTGTSWGASSRTVYDAYAELIMLFNILGMLCLVLGMYLMGK